MSSRWVSGLTNPAIRKAVIPPEPVARGLNYPTTSTDGFGVVGVQTGYSPSDIGGFWESGGFFGGKNGAIGISKEFAGYGIFGWNQATTGNATGIYGLSESTDGYGVYGLHTADSGTNPGVYGETDSTSGSAAGVTGRVDPTNPGGYSAGVRGINDGTGSLGIGVWGSHDGSGWGVYGTAVSGRGVFGYASANSGGRIGVRGDVNGSGNGLYTSDNIYVGGSCTGCTIVFISTNSSQQTLQVGDAVAVSGVGSVLKGHSVPALEARWAIASDLSVLGVVHSRVVWGTLGCMLHTGANAKHLLVDIVTFGIFNKKVSPETAPHKHLVAIV